MNALERSHHELKKLKMMSRCQRFLARVRGTQLLIFLIILGYDLYPYAGMVQAGLMWFVAMVVPPGILIGTMVTRWLARSPGTLIKLMNAAGYATMAIFLLTRGANILFPFWVYAAGHALQWFWLMPADRMTFPRGSKAATKTRNQNQDWHGVRRCDQNRAVLVPARQFRCTA
jgi:hypothetical protein